jgi:hypothetical protein
MRPEDRQRIERATGRAVATWRIPAGGYTAAERYVVELEGGTAFAKIATNRGNAKALRAEHRWTAFLAGRFAPRILAFEDDDDRPLLLIEDLSHGHWPPPWRAGDVQRLRDALAEKAALRPLPDDLPALADLRAALAGWSEVARDPAPFLGLDMCTRPWLDAALPVLLAAEAAVVLEGDDLVHFDVRSDNVCFLDDRVVLVDWSGPVRGPAAFDLACLASSLRLEAGPLPEELLPDRAPYAAALSGYFAAHAGLPSLPDAPRVRWIQTRQLRIALPWACRALGLTLPDWTWSRDATARLDRERAAGRIDDAAWRDGCEEVVADAYLSSADPRRQSGKTGNEIDWRWSRELVLDAVPSNPCALLDVGCANGYLLESLVRWGSERGLAIEPHGLEVSWRLAALARQRLPAWAERIWTGDVRDWEPPRRFDLVIAGLDCAPPGAGRELVDRIVERLLEPGGRLVIRPDRVVTGVPDVPTALRELGIEPGGVLEAIHPETGALRRSAWIGG